MSDAVVICECFARDGLQHEDAFVPTATKVALIDEFTQAGFQRVEATSYSHPQHVPAFADASEVMRALPRRAGVEYKATCPNQRGVHRAVTDLEAGHGCTELSMLVSTTESHTRRNLRTSRARQWERIAEMIELAHGRFRVVGVVSMAFGCPFEGPVPVERTLADVDRFVELGADLVTIGDTTGEGTPRTVHRMFAELATRHPGVPCVAHFHDSRGTALANCVAALEAGCRHFDSAFGGVGGHPAQVRYGQGETGNACTEDLVALLEAMGVSTGLDLPAVARVSERCEQALGRPLNSKVARSGFPHAALARTVEDRAHA